MIPPPAGGSATGGAVDWHLLRKSTAGQSWQCRTIVRDGWRHCRQQGVGSLDRHSLHHNVLPRTVARVPLNSGDLLHDHLPFDHAPKMACLPSSQGVAAKVMKNWLPLVLGPALAMDTTPGPSCRRFGEISSSKV